MLEATEEYIELLTAGLSEQTGIKITRGDGWNYDVKRKILTYDMKDLKYLPFDVIRGLLLHEIGHLLATTVTIQTPLLKKYGERYFQAYNAMEDVRIEGKLKDKFGNFANSALEATNEWCCIDNINKVQGNYSQLSKVKQFLLLMLLRYYSQHYNYVQNIFGGDARYCWEQNLYYFDEQVKNLHGQYSNEITAILDSCLRSETTMDMQKIVDKQLYPIIKPLLDDKEDQKKDKPQDGGKNKQYTIGQENSENVVNPKEGNGLVKGIGEGGLERQRRLSTHPTEKECKSLFRPYATVLAQRLEDVLKEQATVRWTGLHTGGKLLSKNAYKVGIEGDTRVFSRRSNPDTPRYTVTFCIDASGSMEGQNSTYAFLGTALLKDVCERLHFKVNLIAYSREAWKLEKLDDYKDTGGGTCDVEGLKLVEKTINSEDQNIVFMITDGATSRNDEWDQVKHRVERKNAIVYGVGIGTDRIEEYIKKNYENAVYVPDVKDLPKTLISVMRSTIKR